MNSRLRTLVILLLVCAVAWTARKVPGFSAIPLADDDTNILFNPHLSDPNLSSLGWMFTDIHYVHRYMPLGWFGFCMVYSVCGLDPAGYHVADILLHGLNAWLLFLVLCRLLQRFAPGEGDDERILAAGAGALLWAVHPMRVETFAWCSGMLYSQATFFALLCVHSRISEVESRLSGASCRANGWLIAGLLSYAASLLTYPVALFLPIALVVVEWAWTRSPDSGLRGPRLALFGGFLCYFSACAGAVALNIAARLTVSSWLMPTSLGEFGLLARVLQAAYVTALYVGRTLWPFAVLEMKGNTIFDLNPADPIWWICVGTVGMLSCLAWTLRKRAPFVALGWAAYVILIFPNMGILEHPHTASDRYSYLSGMVFSAILAFSLLRIAHARIRQVAWAGCLVAAAGCAALSSIQAEVWRSPRTYLSTVLVRSDNETIRQITVSRLALLKFAEGDVRQGREEGFEQFKKYPKVGGVALTWGQMAPAKALSAEVFSRKLQEWPAAPWAVLHEQTARDEIAQGRILDALAHLDCALELSPDFANPRMQRGLLNAELGRQAEAEHDWLTYRALPSADAGSIAFLRKRIAEGLRQHGERILPMLAEPPLLNP